MINPPLAETSFKQSKGKQMKKYFGNEIEGFKYAAGALLELRADIAYSLLKSQIFHHPTFDSYQEMIETAFQIADVFVAECEKRGDIKPIDMTNEQHAELTGAIRGIYDHAAFLKGNEFAEARAEAKKADEK